jgi:GntR family transcriptional regulator
MTTLAAARRRRADRARQIADILCHQVLAGPGQLPRESQLCHDFEASRNTVREVLALLAAEGLVERLPGVGTTVVAAKYAHGLHRLAGLAETLHQHGEITDEVRALRVIRPPAVVLIERVTGQNLGRADVSIEAVDADPHSAAPLGVADRAALLMVERVSHLADGRPVDLEWIRFRGDRLTLQSELCRGAAVAWQVREGAAKALGPADPDADVRAYARRVTAVQSAARQGRITW